MTKDTEFLTDAQKLRLAVAPTSGGVLPKIVEETVSMPPHVIEAAIAPKDLVKGTVGGGSAPAA